MERLKRPESRRMAQPLASVEAFEGFEGFEGFEAFEGQFRATRKKGFGAPEPRAHSRGLRRLKGSFGPLEKKDLARQSPEPTACATPPTVSQSPEPTVWQVRGFGASEASRIQRLAAPLASAPSPQPAQLRPQSRRAQSPQSGKREVLERLILAEPRDHRASARFWSV